MEVTSLLCDSFVCRLCAEENKHGTNLFPVEENDQDLSQLVNKYLPIKASQVVHHTYRLPVAHSYGTQFDFVCDSHRGKFEAHGFVRNLFWQNLTSNLKLTRSNFHMNKSFCYDLC